MNAFSIGLTAFSAGQRGLDVTGQNIANASTPGYHRQRLNLSPLTYGGQTGVGVQESGITRTDQPLARQAILASNSEGGRLAMRLDSQRRVESVLASGSGSIGDQLEQFFNQVERLTASPEDLTLRRVILTGAANLTRQFNAAASDLNRLRGDQRDQATEAVTQVNSLTARIADLNTRIEATVVRSGNANDLMDQRDQAINDLSQLIDVHTVAQPRGVINVIGPGQSLVVGGLTTTLAASTGTNGELLISAVGASAPLVVRGGKLAGLTEEVNQGLSSYQGRLDAMAKTLVASVNAIHATGIGLNGPVTTMAGTQGVSSATATLATTGLPFAVQAGNLTIGVTDTATGQRTLVNVPINPATQSLQTVASDITTATGGQVQASVDSATGTLRFQAQSGFAFDFAGQPDASGLLVALGVNGMFTGSSSADIAVRPDLLADPSRLNAAQSSQPGDASNLVKLAGLRDQGLFAGGTQTLAQYNGALVGDIGTEVQSLSDQQTAQDGVLQNLTAQEQSAVGVDINEELVNLMQYQRMIEAAGKYIAIANSTFDAILNMVQ